MDNLRLILILIGLAVLAAIWLLHRPEGSSRKPGASRREERRREPFIGDAGGASDPSLPEDPEPDWEPEVEPEPERESESSRRPQQTTLPDLGASGSAPEPEVRHRAPSSRIPPVDQPRRDVPPDSEWRDDEPARAAAAPEGEAAATPGIVTLYVRARGDREISGLSLLDAAIKAGLRFGEMKIFHRRHRGATKPVFSMANITRPGNFDPSGWNLFRTPGVTLFMTLPGPVSALDAWDAMLATGKRLAELLDADLMDDTHCLLTRQRIAQIREDMREFDRRHGLHPD